MRKRYLCLLAIGLAGCPQPPPTAEDLRKHEVKSLAYWTTELARPLDERVLPASPALVDYLGLDNQVNHFAARPETVPLAPATAAAIKATLKMLPDGVRKKLQTSLIGVFPVKGLGSSAYTDFVRDEKGRAVAAFIVFDVEATARKANDWLTWKESSPFRTKAPWRLVGEMEPAATDTPEAALAFILVHEIGHVLAFDSDVHPLWSVPAKSIDPADYPFMDVSWTVKAERYEPKLTAAAPLPGRLYYYKDALDRPSAEELPAFYAWLAKSDFVTLYAATSPYDDFADSLATYVHMIHLKKPFQLRVYKGDELVLTHVPCWEEPRCKAKRAALEAFLAE